MKNLLPAFICILLLVNPGNSQTITRSANEPAVGDVDKNYTLDTSAYINGLPLHQSGTDVVWDFTNLKGAFPVVFDSIVSPASVSGASMFPGATYVQKRGGIRAFFKSVASPSQTEWVGATSTSPSLTVTFTNSVIIANYPVGHGYNMTDTVRGTFKYNTTNGFCNGVMHVTATATGTLLFPGNVNFQNVLLLRSAEHLTMSVGPLPVGAIDQHIYAFYVPGKKFPVLTVQYQKYQLLAGTPTITAQAYGNFSYFTVEGINEHLLENNISIFPNPCEDALNVSVSPFIRIKQLDVLDMQGRLITSSADSKLNMENFTQGIYTLKVTTGAGTVYRKFIRE